MKGTESGLTAAAAMAGDEVVLFKVLLITEQNGDPTIGTPAVDAARVVAKIIQSNSGAKKIIIQKFRKRRKMFAAVTVIASPTMVQITSVRSAPDRLPLSLSKFDQSAKRPFCYAYTFGKRTVFAFLGHSPFSCRRGMLP